MLPWLQTQGVGVPPGLQPETRPVTIVTECWHGDRRKVWKYHLGFIQIHDMLLFFWSVAIVTDARCGSSTTR